MATGDVGYFRLSHPVLLREIRKAAGQAGGRGPLLPVGLDSAAPGLASQQKAVTAISAWGRVFTRTLDTPPVGFWPVPPEGVRPGPGRSVLPGTKHRSGGCLLRLQERKKRRRIDKRRRLYCYMVRRWCLPAGRSFCPAAEFSQDRRPSPTMPPKAACRRSCRSRPTRCSL